MDVQGYLAEAAARVDRFLDESLPAVDEPP